MNKELYEKIINMCINHGCDFAEVYYEKGRRTKYTVLDKKLDDINYGQTEGVGIRVSSNSNIYYTSTNTLTEENILKITNKMLDSIKKEKPKLKMVKLGKMEEKRAPIRIKHNDFPAEKKRNVLKTIDKSVRKFSNLISQVTVFFIEEYKEYEIANSNKKFIKSDEIQTRLFCLVNAQKDEKKGNSYKSIGASKGYEFLEGVDIENFGIDAAKEAIKKLDSVPFKGGEMPVILGNGFAAVIFHEACGHALEATTVSDGVSIFSNCLNQKIASDKVTLIDDGTIPGEWGSTIIDSEGNKTQKNILIENGVLKKYLIDDLNAIKMKLPATGSGRRESYEFPPTSRMNNTYLAAGTDKFEDMLKSIDYGLYCKKMEGGSVYPQTGEFNFTVGEAYIIEKGQLKDVVSGITLIGKGQDILKEVEMVSDDLYLEPGYCISASGGVPVTVGEPTIKIRKILVGGTDK